MARLPMASIRPARIPDGFRLRNRVDGPVAGGFPPEAEQTLLLHTRSWRMEDIRRPLLVFATPDVDQELIGTHDRAGTPVDLGIPGVSAVYHDGVWQVDADIFEAEGLDAAMRWDTTSVHSLTVRTADRVFGVRAPREIDVEELVAVVRSLPIG